MIQTALTAALLAGAAPHSSQDTLLGLMPEGAALVMYAGDFASLMADEQKGDWGRFITDPRVQVALQAAMGDSVELGEDPAARFGAVLSCIRGGALAIEDFDNESIVAAVRTTDGFQDHLNAFLESTGSPCEPRKILGRDGFLGSDGGLDIAFVEVDGLTLIGAGLVGTATDVIERLSQSMEDGPRMGNWWDGVDGRVNAPLVEAFLRFGGLPTDNDPEMEIAAEYIDTIMLGFGIGDGNEGTLGLGIGVHENEIFSEFAGAFGEADDDLLYVAPVGVETIQIGNMDLGALTRAGVLLAKAVDGSGDVDANYEAALGVFESTTGLSLEDDIFAALTGNYFGVQWAQDVDSVIAGDQEALFDAFPVLGAEISDPEPFVQLVESLEPLLGMVDAEISDDDIGTTLRLSPLPGREAVITVTNHAILVALDGPRLAATAARIGSTTADGGFDEKTIAKAKAAMSGAGISIYPFDVLKDAFRALADEEGAPEEVFGVLDAFEDAIDGVGMVDFDVSPRSFTFRMMTR